MVTSIANPFYPEFALAVERAARKNGHFVIVCNTNEDPVISRAYLDQIAGTLSEGVLVMNRELDFDDLHTTAHAAPQSCCACGSGRMYRRDCPASPSIFLRLARWPHSICSTSGIRGLARLSAASGWRTGSAVRRLLSHAACRGRRIRAGGAFTRRSVQGGYEAARELLRSMRTSPRSSQPTICPR